MQFPTSEPPGGLGGSRGEDHDELLRDGIKQTRLLSRAIKLGWEIPEDLRPAIIARLTGVLRTPGLSPRELRSAANGLMATIKLEHDALDLAIRVDEHARLVARLEAVEGKLQADQDK